MSKHVTINSPDGGRLVIFMDPAAMQKKRSRSLQRQLRSNVEPLQSYTFR